MIKAIIFDMDGVIIDSVGFHYDIWKRIAEKYGAELSYNDFKESLNGMSTPETSVKLIRMFNINASKEEITAEKWALIKKSIGMMPLFEGAKETIKTFKRLGYKIGLGTSARRELTELSLGPNLEDIEFDAVVTSDDVKHTKPYPDIFLKCAEMLIVKPEECAVIEDAKNGITAAKKAGMKAIGVTTTSEPEDLKEADIIVQSIKDVNNDLIKKIEGEKHNG